MTSSALIYISSRGSSWVQGDKLSPATSALTRELVPQSGTLLMTNPDTGSSSPSLYVHGPSCFPLPPRPPRNTQPTAPNRRPRETLEPTANSGTRAGQWNPRQAWAWAWATRPTPDTPSSTENHVKPGNLVKRWPPTRRGRPHAAQGSKRKKKTKTLISLHLLPFMELTRKIFPNAQISVKKNLSLI